ncbi:MAG TPA: nucleotidyltransferase substrate binding protein [Victivallales bacterium]|jgi:nucleotidyltransferase substrate binding protein (TIGR01987 family)|nr:nucleotidyltransferase substrate binding protein [Victivallales bacterium]HRS63069.1 nucleotidyltransferase substrate binding protein [Spirochaetota bacterium]HRU66560.1 nucleotidyltransferase substrate binding protein [Spirochaetota bacterium]
MNERIKSLFEDYRKAFQNLQKAIAQSKEDDDLAIDGTIKRFELLYELSWKLMRSYLADMGIVVNNPRDTYKNSYQNGLIQNQEVWLEMIEDRNRLVHTYTFEESRDIFNKIKKDYIHEFEFLLKKFQEVYSA